LSELDISVLQKFFDKIEIRLTKNQNTIAKEVLKEIRARIQFLMEVGLDYVTLNRSSRTLSGGEAQRIRLASQIGSRLVGTLYILDEPTIGLDPLQTLEVRDAAILACMRITGMEYRNYFPGLRTLEPRGYNPSTILLPATNKEFRQSRIDAWRATRKP
jgi:excinuclease UvrABC ATPase subunit